LKLWIQKLIDQLDYNETAKTARAKLSEERATILYLLDVYGKNLFDFEAHPVRRAREEFDQFTREFISAEKTDIEKALFRFRQYFASYRVAEYAHVQKSFEDFKNIIWNFVEQLGEDFAEEQVGDKHLNAKLEQLKDAVEANSIEDLREKSKEFINLYVNNQNKKDQRRLKRMRNIRKNLDLVKTRLSEADRNLKVDHLTQLFNRRSFDEHIKEQASFGQMENAPVTLLSLDIDHFKKVNDTYGHDIGDFVLQECGRILRECFNRDSDFVARVGGEEFAVVLSSHSLPIAIKRAEDTLERIRREVFVKDTMELRFTVSMGIAQLQPGESVSQWMKRADSALYDSKHSGRNRFTVSQPLQAVS
jgi:diguanylate cyclase